MSEYRELRERLLQRALAERERAERAEKDVAELRRTDDITMVAFGNLQQKFVEQALRAEKTERERDELRADVAWCEKLFERKWDGTIGHPSGWFLRGDWRHVIQKMRGETFHDAIRAAMNPKEVQP